MFSENFLREFKKASYAKRVLFAVDFSSTELADIVDKHEEDVAKYADGMLERVIASCVSGREDFSESVYKAFVSRFFRQGLTLEEIAKETNLDYDCIRRHCARFFMKIKYITFNYPFKDFIRSLNK